MEVIILPSNPRVRDNNVFGTTTDNPLTAGAVSFNSTGLINLSTIASKHAIVTLDPLRQFGNPEIVIVTVHTAASTVATIIRGAYNTVAREHPAGTLWVHAPLDEDFIEIVTSVTRSSDPYRGQMIFETDTNSFVARSTADSWENIVWLGPWVSYTPIWTNVTPGAGSTTSGQYTKIGRTVFFRATIVLGTGGTLTGSISVSLPINAASLEFPGGGATGAQINTNIGVTFGDQTGATYPGFGIIGVATAASLRVIQTDSLYAFQNVTSATIPFTWAINDRVFVEGYYEAVS